MSLSGPLTLDSRVVLFLLYSCVNWSCLKLKHESLECMWVSESVRGEVMMMCEREMQVSQAHFNLFFFFFLTIDCDYSSELQTGSIASSRLSYSCVSVLFSALKEVSETSVTAKPQSHFLKICFYLQYTLGFKSLWALVKMHVFRSLLEDYWQQHWSYKDKAWWSCNVTRLSVSLQNKNLKKHQKHNYVHQALIKLQII